MIKLFNFLFGTVPMMLSCLYLLVAVFCVVVHIKLLKRKEKPTIGQWAFAVLNTGYVLFFFVTKLFFPSLWEQSISTAGVIAIIISSILSRYEDRRQGRRWWHW